MSRQRRGWQAAGRQQARSLAYLCRRCKQSACGGLPACCGPDEDREFQVLAGQQSCWH